MNEEIYGSHTILFFFNCVKSSGYSRTERGPLFLSLSLKERERENFIQWSWNSN